MTKNTSKFFVFLLAVAVILGGGVFYHSSNCKLASAPIALSFPSSPAEDVQSPPSTPKAKKFPSADLSGWVIYRSEEDGFQFQYPPGGDLQTYSETADKQLRLDLPVTGETLLTEKFLLVKVRQASGQKPGSLSGKSTGEVVVINGRKFVKKHVSEGAAGHIYDHVIYSTREEDRRYILDFVPHSVNPGVFDNPPPDFDREESRVFIGIISTFRVKP